MKTDKLSIVNKIDRKKIFLEYPLPEKYNNPETEIKIYQSFKNYDFKIFAANPNLPPLQFNIKTKEWEELKLGIPMEYQ